MNKNVKIIIALLLISNLILIGFLYIGKPNKHNRKVPREVIIERLNFDESQVASYSKLIEAHSDAMKKNHEKIVAAKNELHKSLKEDSPVLNDSIRGLIMEGIKEIETLHFNHFMKIKELCNDSQKEKFNEMADELSSIFQPNKRQKKQEHDK